MHYLSQIHNSKQNIQILYINVKTITQCKNTYKLKSCMLKSYEQNIFHHK